MPWLVFAAGAAGVIGALICGAAATCNIQPHVKKQTESERRLLRFLTVFLVLSVLVSLCGGLLVWSDVAQAHAYADRRAQLSTVANGFARAENALYARHGRYTSQPILDIFPTDPALAAAATRNGIEVSVRESPDFPGKRVLVSIKFPPVYQAATATTFALALRGGVATAATCRGSSHLGCRGGQWNLD
jgi:hypothetical protein